jgi:predicted flap endonuclease-1-like 5' DNA nuclease
MFALVLLEEAGPNTELGWLLYLMLGFFLLMVLVGWWASTQKNEQVDAPQEAQAHHEGHIEPKEHVQDDLTKLEGIGPKVAKVLGQSGITTFAGLARANASDVQKALSAAGLQMMNPEGWIEQAGLAAKNDWAGLEKLQGELKGGRRK